MSDEPNFFGVEPGCETHGEEGMRECSMCGAEFCRICFPGSVCPDCRQSAIDDGDEEDGEEEYEELVDDDEEVEKLLAEADAEFGDELAEPEEDEEKET